MSKVIDIQATIYELYSKHPEVLPIMVELGFDQIAKPGMLQTAGRVMTLPKGCRMRGIPIETVKEAFRNHGFEIEGE
ncbi:DUF1858 domain-containing protein [Bacillus sp. AGMB 02131]|uniref:DUF1858 domain-containing protein n=1 Tax=Peribacillus faecalis TaxID=2772559 RepID=A0A927CUK2_9BACI|nr:DUF1858 domain-containing protein [Peribacillus faecalis]MBD3107464.1 DUF1858 domain-containing protein [Peribacillus faecalis]